MCCWLTATDACSCVLCVCVCASVPLCLCLVVPRGVWCVCTHTRARARSCSCSSCMVTAAAPAVPRKRQQQVLASWRSPLHCAQQLTGPCTRWPQGTLCCCCCVVVAVGSRWLRLLQGVVWVVNMCDRQTGSTGMCASFHKQLPCSSRHCFLLAHHTTQHNTPPPPFKHVQPLIMCATQSCSVDDAASAPGSTWHRADR